MSDVQASINLYNEVLKEGIRSILKSNLLTDEDTQVLNHNWREHQVVPSHRMLCTVSSLSFLTGVLSALNQNARLTTAMACLTPLSMYAAIKLNEFKHKRKIPGKITKLLKLFKSYNRLNHTVANYYEQRYAVLFTLRFEPSKLFIKIMSENSKDFLHSYITKLFKFIKFLITSMRDLKTYSNIKEIDYYLSSSQWDLTEFDVKECDNINEITENFERLNQLCILVTSNFLACLGLTFCFDLWRDYTCDLQAIFNDVIPNVTNICENIYDAMNEGFRRIRFSVPKVTRKEIDTNAVSLEKPLLDFLNEIQIIFDIGKCLEKTLTKEKLNDVDKLMEYIDVMSLRHSNSRTPLLAMEKMLIKYKTDKVKEPIDDHIDLVEVNQVEEKKVTIRYDDPTGATEDEEFVLSSYDTDEEDEYTEYNDEKFQNMESHRLMLSELDNKLSVIRKIKGIEESTQSKYPENKSAGGDVAEASGVTISKTLNLQMINIPPPPPPPLPIIVSVSSLAIMTESSDESAEIIRIDRAAIERAKRRNIEEEIFSLDSDIISD